MERKAYFRKRKLIQLSLFGMLKEEEISYEDVPKVNDSPPEAATPEEDLKLLPDEAEPATSAPEAGTLIYVTGSMSIDNWHKELSKDDNEDMYYVVGLRIGDCLTLDNIVRFKLSRRNLISARAEAEECLKALLFIERYGYLLNALIHIHPGTGPNSTNPSDTDRENQKILEAGHYRTISAIFSRDKFIRFFSNNLKFNIKILGKGVVQHDENLFQITEV